MCGRAVRHSHGQCSGIADFSIVPTPFFVDVAREQPLAVFKTAEFMPRTECQSVCDGVWTAISGDAHRFEVGHFKSPNAS